VCVLARVILEQEGAKLVPILSFNEVSAQTLSEGDNYPSIDFQP